MEEQDFVAQDTALESMRSSDFDCYSAYGEVIDNSIQALASDIRIYFEESENLVKNKKKISKVFFADNGIGMNSDLLHKCLKLGLVGFGFTPYFAYTSGYFNGVAEIDNLGNVFIGPDKGLDVAAKCGVFGL